MSCRNNIEPPKDDQGNDPLIHPDAAENPFATAEAAVVGLVIAGLAIVALVLALCR